MLFVITTTTTRPLHTLLGSADDEDLQAGLDNLHGPRAPTDVQEAYAKIRVHLTNVDLSVDANRPKYLTHEWEERPDWYDVVQSKLHFRGRGLGLEI